MADHIERVIVQGEVELDTSAAEKKKENLAKPIKIELSANDKAIFNNITSAINVLQVKIDRLNFKNLEKKLSKSLAESSKNGVDEIKNQAKLIDDAFNKTLWKSMDKNGNKTSHTFAGVLRDMRQELVSMSTYISKLTNSKDNELSLKVKIENINDFTQSMQEAKGRIETFQDVLDQLDNNSVFSLLNEQIKDITSSIQILTNNFKELNTAAEKYANLPDKVPKRKKVSSDKTIGQIYEEKRKEEKRIAAEKKALEKLQNEEDKKAAKIQKQKDSQTSVNYVDMAIARREKEARDFAKRLKNDMSERYDISKTLDKFQKWDDKIKSYNELGSKFEGATAYQKILPVLEKVKNAFSDINSEIAKGDNADFSKIEQQMNEIASSVKKVDTAFEGLQKPAGNLGKIASNDTLSWLEKNTKALKKYGEELKEIATLQAKATTKGELDSLTGRRNELVSSAKREGLVGKNWTDSFKKSLGSLSQIFGSFSLLNRADDIAHEMIGTIHEVDDALTDLQMATSVSDKEAQSLMETYSQMGKELKATGVDVAKSNTEWLKQGKSLKEAETLTTDSIILSKVGDLSSEESTKYLTSAMKGFKVEAKDALNIVDQLSAVDMASATDVGGLAEAMSKTAVTAQDAGIEMQRLIGYIATVGETTQADMGSVGNAFKTIFTRMSDIKAGKFKLIDEDGTTETLSDVEQTLSNVGIDLRKTVTEYNDYGDVLDNLASKWDNLSQLQQNALAKAFAGTRQAEVFRTLMANYDSAKKYMQTANESEGYATEKFEAYQNSLSGAIEGFKNSFQTLSNTVVGSDFLKGIVNAGTTTLNILDSIIERLGTIPSLLGAFGIFQGFQGGGWSSQKIVCVSL